MSKAQERRAHRDETPQAGRSATIELPPFQHFFHPVIEKLIMLFGGASVPVDAVIRSELN